MRNLGASVMWRCRELKADFLDADENAALDGWNKDDLYKGEYLVETAREVVAKFGADRPRGVDFFRKVGLAFMLQLIQKDLNAFRVEMNGWFSESQLYEKGTVDKALETLRAGGHLKDEDGALWFVSTAFGDDKDRVIKRKDERPTYFASDIAYHGLKFERGFERLVDIWGTDHHGYVKRVKSAVQALGRDPEKLDILLYQLVSLVRDGKPVAMSTRSGEFVTLREVVDEVGADAARFFFAMRSPNSQLEFDLELAKKQAPENPVFYVQYVHARCCSLFREAEKRGVRPGAPDGLRAPAELEPAERALLLRLASYPDVVQLCGRDLTPHHLTVFLMSLAGDYHRFYEQCRVLGDAGEATSFRLALVDGVRTLIRSGLSLIGVTAPETM
jgi:arginyl-tRNA synthetase